MRINNVNQFSVHQNNKQDKTAFGCFQCFRIAKATGESVPKAWARINEAAIDFVAKSHGLDIEGMKNKSFFENLNYANAIDKVHEGFATKECKDLNINAYG